MSINKDGTAELGSSDFITDILISRVMKQKLEHDSEKQGDGE